MSIPFEEYQKRAVLFPTPTKSARLDRRGVGAKRIAT
jgi:hypothetical protein